MPKFVCSAIELPGKEPVGFLPVFGASVQQRCPDWDLQSGGTT